MYAEPATGMVEASSAYDSAENTQVRPARTKESTIAGPESPIASPMITKMPVPMMAPMPSAVRSSAPTALRSFVPSSPVSATSRSTSLVANRPPRTAAALLGCGARSPASGCCST